ncbi:hypothetical protein CW714_10210 [Methanophagales archaeon]|nr:MAG: hypothetical protein CW714_10210 [Methanophagales archaeon]
MRNTACVKLPFAGKKCAWDVLKVSYPGISTLERELVSLNSDLKEWESASVKVSNTLPNVISGFEDLEMGKEMSPMLQSDIRESMSSFGTLKTKTDDMDRKLSDVSDKLSDAERAIRSVAGDAPLVGSFISEFADFIGNVNDEVKSLRKDTQSFSNTLSKQSSKLSNVVNTANKKTDELYSSWSSRRNAAVMVFSTLRGIIAVIFVILAVLIHRRRKRGEPVGEREKTTERTVKGKIKTPKAEWKTRKITGIIIAGAGLFGVHPC